MLKRTTIRNWTILLGSTMTVLAAATIAPALPEMSRFFKDAPNADFLVRLVLTIPGLTIAISAPFVGILLDRWGRRPVLILSVLLYGLTGPSGFFLDTLPAILIGRALLGFAVAGILSGFTTLIADYFSGEKRNQFMGFQASVMAFGGVVFLLLGGVLADIGWRYPFLIYLFAVVIFPGVLFAIDEPKILTSSDQKAVSDSSTTSNLKSIALIYSIGFVYMVVFFLVPVQLPFFLTTLTGVSNSMVGIALASQALMAAIISLQYQRFKARFSLSFQTIASLIFLSVSVGYFIIGSSISFLPVVLGLLFSGIGLGLMLPNINLWLVSVIPAAIRGRAIGGMTSLVFLGQFLSPIISQPIAQRLGLPGTFVVGSGAMLFVALVLYIGGRLVNPKNAQ
ncbi:MAG: MFS transporter [Anaerolineae bacterium]|nr:MFS transporter [Anaerolineae bacterium]